MAVIDVAEVRSRFPILSRQLDGKRLVYLDSASSSQRPEVVLDAMDDLYRDHYANVHRGVYRIAEEATNALEGRGPGSAGSSTPRRPRKWSSPRTPPRR